ncbi:MAG: FtsX-like permease family protein [Acetobacteraceae bacterium]|nr:FtsX-like permease family protein [Acetobacteraceae bacterium]
MTELGARCASAWTNLPLAFRLARRELRGGIRGLKTVLLCLALGAGIIAAVGSLRAAVDAGLAADGRRILGGDIEVDGANTALPDTLRSWLREQGAATSDIVTMRSLLVSPSGDRTLIELKAVDAAWPLVGASEASPPQPIATALAKRDGHFGLLADRLVLDRLGLKPGDTARLGTATFRVAGALTSEPDRVATPSMFGPRVLISAAALAETELVAPGTMARYAMRATLSPLAASVIPALLRERFPNQGWRIRDPREAAPGVTRFLDQTSLFLTLVGLTSLLVGGIGVANGVGVWLDARGRTIATLRCLGASSGLVLTVCMIQVMSLAVLGVLVGLVLGAAVPVGVALLPEGWLPVPPVAALYPKPLALALCFGLLTALCFALWPLGRAARIPGAALFRDLVVPERTRPHRGVIAVNTLTAAVLAGVTVGSAADRWFALYFCAGALATLGLFRLAAFAVMRLARALPVPRIPWARLGIANLHRPGAATPSLMLSVGLGLSTLATVALIQHNIRAQILEQIPSAAPSFFFVDIQNDQMDRFRDLAHAIPGRVEINDVPSLRARVTAIKGIPADQADVAPESAWALKGDRGLTYATSPPPHTRLVAGSWWPQDYDGPPLVSFDAGLAKGWHVGVGDIIQVNVLGRDIDLRIASLRDIAWQSLSINFFMVASPGVLSHAPHTHIATVRVDPAHDSALLRAVTDGLPNVTGIRVADVLTAISALLDQVANALAATGLLTMLSGMLVLVSAVAAGQSRRAREAVILRVLGATSAQIRASWAVEFGLIGIAAGLVSALVGSASSYGVAHYILHTSWVFSWPILILTLAGALATMLVFGYIGLAATSRTRPAQLLRNE